MCFVSCLSSVNVVSVLKPDNVGATEVFNATLSSMPERLFQLGQFSEDFELNKC